MNRRSRKNRRREAEELNITAFMNLMVVLVPFLLITAVAAANPAEKADLLSASISVAMNTTALGLMVAIPLLLVHAVLQTKTTELVDSLEMATVKFLNTVSERPTEEPAL